MSETAEATLGPADFDSGAVTADRGARYSNRRVKSEEPPVKPTVGRIVHYRTSIDERCLMAFVVRVWDGTEMLNLQVMFDGTNDRAYTQYEEEATRGMGWRTSVHREPNAQVQPYIPYWHWPEREDGGAS